MAGAETLDAALIEPRKARARSGSSLRDEICAAFERLEDDAPAALHRAARDARAHALAAHRSRRRPRRRRHPCPVMRGRLFEKVGVHCSTVHGEFAPEARSRIPGAADHPAFWASGISLIAHAQSEHPCRAYEHPLRRHHQRRGSAAAPTTPLLARQRNQQDPDTTAFHAAMRAACDAHAAVAD